MNDKNKTKKIFYGTVFVLIVILAIVFTLATIYRAEMANNEKSRKVENDSMMLRIGKLLKLPDETPIISTVSSKDDFKDAPAFRSAEKGDKLIVWVNSNQAILYRPSTNKVLDLTTAKVVVETIQ